MQYHNFRLAKSVDMLKSSLNIEDLQTNNARF